MQTFQPNFFKIPSFLKKKIHGAVHGWIHKMAHAHSGGTWFGRPSVNLLSYFVLHALPVFGGYSRIPFGHPEKGYGISPEASLGATFPCPAQGGAASIGRTRRRMWQYRENIFVDCQNRRDVACH